MIVLREDTTANSHHLNDQKGPQIITFNCQGNIDTYSDTIKQSGFKVRDRLSLPEYAVQYLFIEYVDGNEICLTFPIR